MKYGVEATIDGSMPVYKEIRADSEAEARGKAQSVIAADARARGLDHVYSDWVDIESVEQLGDPEFDFS